MRLQDASQIVAERVGDLGVLLLWSNNWTQVFPKQPTYVDQKNMFEKENNAEPILESPEYITQLAGKDIIQLKSNTIPKSLVPLEEIFDNNDVARNPKVSLDDAKVEDCNIGIV